jgi:hypothetical protein
MQVSDAIIDLARYAHILAFSFGIGVALLADLMMLSRRHAPLDRALVSALEGHHAMIAKALGAMWVSGLVLIGLRTGFDVTRFTPKLISKLATVLVLTGNAVMIGRLALPILRAGVGQRLTDLPARRTLCLAVLGGVSSGSWLLALAMGSSKMLATSGWTVFVTLVPLAYLTAIIVAALVLFQSRSDRAAVKGLAPARNRSSLAMAVPVPAPIPAGRHPAAAVPAE